MAEALINVGPHPTLEDGQVIVSWTDTEIRSVHAQHFCNIRHAGYTRNGLRPRGSLAEAWLKETARFVFYRYGREVSKWRIAGKRYMMVGIYGPRPHPRDGQYIHIGQFLTRRLQHCRHAIFGRPGREYWYGGETPRTAEQVAAVWAEIQRQTGARAERFSRWPATERELCRFLQIRTTEHVPKGAIVPWWELIPTSQHLGILDQCQLVDTRERILSWQPLEKA